MSSRKNAVSKDLAAREGRGDPGERKGHGALRIG